MITRKLSLVAVAVFCVLATVLLSGAPAFASATHVFSKAFGAPCSTAPCGAGQFKEPDGVAVNESTVNGLTGDVYVVDKGNDRVEYFSSTGEYKGEFNGSGENVIVEKEPAPTGRFSGPESIAVDNDPQSPSFGDVYVADRGHSVVDKFSSTGAYIGQITGTPAGTFEALGTATVDGVTYVYPIDGIAVAPDGELWVTLAYDSIGKAVIFGFSDARQNGYRGERQLRNDPGGDLTKGQFGQSGPVLAVDSSENLYVRAGHAVEGVYKLNLSGAIEEFLSSEEKPFETGALQQVSGIAVEPTTGDVYLDEHNSKRIARFLPNKTEVEDFGEQQLTGGGGVAISSGTVDVYVADMVANVVDIYIPEISKPSVESEAFSEVSSHSATLSAQVNTHGLKTTYTVEYGTSEAYGSTVHEGAIAGSFGGPVQISAALDAVLQPETTYHFRVVAKNDDGTVSGADVTFNTLSDRPGLPDGRGYELVSPVASADGNAYELYEPVNGSVAFTENTLLSMRASVDGGAVEYVAAPLASGGNGRVGFPKGNEFVATRGPGGGWSTVDMETAGLNGSPFEALFSSELVNGGTSVIPAGSHSLGMSGEGLFDSVGGRSVLVSVLPSVRAGEQGVPVAGATFGGPLLYGRHLGGEEGPDFSHVISGDGSRIFWTDLEAGAYMDRLFVRENDDLTVPVSVGAAKFWTASNDGRYVFYTEGESLWRFDVESETREELAGEGAGVLGVIGINETGEDGAYVYFVAQGVLASGATPGNCSPGSGFCNLYVRHGGVTKFVTVLSGKAIRPASGGSEGEGDWLADLRARTAEVASDGRAVVFMSAVGFSPHREVYVYDADTGRVSCASCNPSGEAPSGEASLPRSLNGGVSGSGGTFMRRWISEDGTRVFFDSTEALVPQDTDGTTDVYEWEQYGTGSCQNPKNCVYLLSGGTSSTNSFFLDASASGDDVFMITRAQLVPEDQGETVMVYDARVGALRRPVEPACTGTGCQGLPSAPPLFATPSSVTFNGVGNFSQSPPTAAPGLKPKAVKCSRSMKLSHGKCVKIKSRGKRKAKKASRRRGVK